MSQRDIERLRALEKEIRAECPSYCGPDVTYQVDAAAVWAIADKLAGIIAELGQEVGAVADTVGVLTVRRWRGIDAMVNHEFEYLGDLPDGTYSLFTSSAHTSEARDAVVTDAMVEAALDAQPFTADNVSHRVWQLVSQALTDEERRTMMRAALDAAMRQEAE